MNRQFTFFSALFLLFSMLVSSQEIVSIRKKDFKTGEEGFREAWKHIGDGDNAYLLGEAGFETAYHDYLKAWNYNKENAELNYKLGVCALFGGYSDKAYTWLQSALAIKPDVARDILLLTGHALQYRGDFSGASELFNKYINSNVKKSLEQERLASQYLEQSISAGKIIADTLRISVSGAGSNINSPYDDYSEIITSDGTFLCFTSRRPLTDPGTLYHNGKYDENIYVASVQDDSWGEAQLLEKRLTTRFSETPLFFSKASDSLYVYEGNQGEGDIKVSVRKKSGWSLPENISQKINTRYHESAFCLNAAGDEAWFVSDMKKDNLGGKDIYFTRKNSKGKWSEPQNAGNIINTEYDEESVALSSTGDTLWFSSKGHDSIGGYDIFYSVKNKSGEWDKVRNAGFPLNTPWDELFYLPSPGEEGIFYFVSDRPGGLGGLDIYKGSYLKPQPAAQTTTVVQNAVKH